MKTRLLIAIAGFALMATPALASSTTVEFASDSGQKLVVVFDSNGTATAEGGAPVAYTLDQAAKKICSVYNGQDLCVTFGDIGAEVGFSTTYVNTAGDKGTATITAVSE